MNNLLVAFVIVLFIVVLYFFLWHYAKPIIFKDSQAKEK